MSLQEAETLALQILKAVMEEKINSTNVEIASITVAHPRFRVYGKDEVQTIIDQLK
jgi:20S proteasome subunit alpha 5